MAVKPATIAETLLRPFAQVILARDLGVGALVLAAVATRPRLAAAAFAAAGLAALFGRLFGLPSPSVREGIPGCAAVLSTVALAVFAPGGGNPFLLIVLAAAFGVLYTAAFQSLLAAQALPAHALPFLATTYTLHLAARMAPSGSGFSGWLAPWPFLSHLLPTDGLLGTAATLVFDDGGVAGLLILVAILWHSRIAGILFLAGALSAMAAVRVLGMGPSPLAGFNGVLTAMAIGGIWFVPSPSAIALASTAAFLSALLAHALLPVLGAMGLPVLSLPFSIVVILVLSAARLRERDRRPRSAPPADRPEEALARHLLRVRRFGGLSWLPFRLPFRGEWQVTQGHDGAHTHKGPWRHGLDFEGRTTDGKAHQGEGKELRDYATYGLPVVAAGAGHAVAVVAGVPDNPPGDINTRDNWGNAVVVMHGPGLYSVYAHLQPKSLRVRIGDVITPGMELGRAGNSGRSPTPHLHFQVQREPVLGSPTIAFEFGDVVESRDETAVLSPHSIPREGATVRPVMKDDELARAFAFPPGSRHVLHEPSAGRHEEVEVEIDLLGIRSFRSPLGRLSFDVYDNGFVLLDFSGSARSLLRLLLVACARIPFDKATRVEWEEALPRRLLLPRLRRTVADLASVVIPSRGPARSAYSLERAVGGFRMETRMPGWETRTRFDLATRRFEISIEQDARVRTLLFHPEETP